LDVDLQLIAHGMLDEVVHASRGIDRMRGIYRTRVDREWITGPVPGIQYVDHIHIVETHAEADEHPAKLDHALERRIRTGRVIPGEAFADDVVTSSAECNDAEIGVEAAHGAAIAAQGLVQQADARRRASHVEGRLSPQIALVRAAKRESGKNERAAAAL